MYYIGNTCLYIENSCIKFICSLDVLTQHMAMASAKKNIAYITRNPLDTSACLKLPFLLYRYCTLVATGVHTGWNYSPTKAQTTHETVHTVYQYIVQRTKNRSEYWSKGWRRDPFPYDSILGAATSYSNVLCHSWFCQVLEPVLTFLGVTHHVIKAQPNNYGNRVTALDVQWHSKLLWNIQEKTYIFGERVSWSGPCHLPTLVIKVSCSQRVFIVFNPGRIPLHMQSICGKCVYVLACAT